MSRFQKRETTYSRLPDRRWASGTISMQHSRCTQAKFEIQLASSTASMLIFAQKWTVSTCRFGSAGSLVCTVCKDKIEP